MSGMGANHMKQKETAACGLSLLFRKGERPDAAMIRALAAQNDSFAISHDPASRTGADEQIAVLSPLANAPLWVELLVDGLTLDLSGLSAGVTEDCPACAHRFDLSDELDAYGVEALLLKPGPHLSGGAGLTPVIRAMLGLASELCTLDGIVAVVWHPARSWISPRYFASITRNWLDGGVFPGLGLVGLGDSADGGMQSEGMSFFVGQEVRVEPELTEDRPGAARIAMRAIAYLAERGPLEGAEHIAGPEGRALRIEPSANRRFVRVWGG